MKRALLLALFLAATPAIAASPNDWVVGRWFGTGQPDDKSEMYLDHFGADAFHGGDRLLHQLVDGCIKAERFTDNAEADAAQTV